MKMTVMEAAMRGVNGHDDKPVIVSVPKKSVDYEAAIDALIPEATRIANATVGPESELATSAAVAAWARAFHEAVDELAHSRGLRTMWWIAQRDAAEQE